MIYSCFNERAGHYEYFEDDRAQAMNGDLPVPSFKGKQAGKVGVPARDAGRRLPSDVKRVGVGWEARGMVVQCKNTGMRGLQGMGATPNGASVPWWLIAAAAVVGVLVISEATR